MGRCVASAVVMIRLNVYKLKELNFLVQCRHNDWAEVTLMTVEQVSLMHSTTRWTPLTQAWNEWIGNGLRGMMSS
jgi:hypothetical protein